MFHSNSFEFVDMVGISVEVLLKYLIIFLEYFRECVLDGVASIEGAPEGHLHIGGDRYSNPLPLFAHQQLNIFLIY